MTVKIIAQRGVTSVGAHASADRCVTPDGPLLKFARTCRTSTSGDLLRIRCRTTIVLFGVLRRVMRDTRPPGDLRRSRARIADADADVQSRGRRCIKIKVRATALRHNRTASEAKPDG